MTAESEILPKAYDPTHAESHWYPAWEKAGYFSPDLATSAEPYCIVIPPPNVTGSLHMGHALTVSLEDLLIRWRRMQGRKTLWVPGTDHAGIATQMVVERELKKTEKKSRHDLGRGPGRELGGGVRDHVTAGPGVGAGRFDQGPEGVHGGQTS